MKTRCCSTECRPRRCRHRKQQREERWVLRRRTVQVEQQVVEGPDIAPAVRELLGQQVVRARITERGNLRVDDDDERDADRELSNAVAASAGTNRRVARSRGSDAAMDA